MIATGSGAQIPCSHAKEKQLSPLWDGVSLAWALIGGLAHDRRTEIGSAHVLIGAHVCGHIGCGEIRHLHILGVSTLSSAAYPLPATLVVTRALAEFIATTCSGEEDEKEREESAERGSRYRHGD